MMFWMESTTQATSALTNSKNLSKRPKRPTPTQGISLSFTSQFTNDVEEDSYRENQLIHYFNVMEKGKKIVRWPPPWFSPTITILQLVLFSVNSIAGGTLVKYLQFHT